MTLIFKKIQKTSFNPKGRHLVAARDIPVGEMLVVEEPLCSILAPEKLGMSLLLNLVMLHPRFVNASIVVGFVMLLSWIIVKSSFYKKLG